MTIDTVFFDRLLKILETNHNIVRANQDELFVTEAWLAFSDQTIIQAKQVLVEQKLEEEREAVLSDMGDLMSDDFNYDMFEIAMRKVLEKLNLDD